MKTACCRPASPCGRTIRERAPARCWPSTAPCDMINSQRRVWIPPARRFSLGRRRSRNPGAVAASSIPKLVHSLKETRTDYRPVRKPGIKKLASRPAATWRARPRPRHLVESSEREWRPPWEGSMPMDPATEQVLQVALALPEAARLELVEALLAAQEQSSAPPFGSAWLSEIRRRSDEVEAGTVQPDPWHVVRQRVRERLEERSSG